MVFPNLPLAPQGIHCPEELVIEVTKDDLRQGNPSSLCFSPVGLALMRATGAPRVRVRGYRAITVYSHAIANFGRVSYRGGKDFARFMLLLDLSPRERKLLGLKDPKPATFILRKENY